MSRRIVAAVLTALAVAATVGFVAGRPAGAAAKPPEPTADGPGADPYRPIVDQAVIDVAAKLGVPPLATSPLIEPLKKKLSGGGQYAHTWFYGDPFSACLIQIQPAGQKLDATDLDLALTHEVVHCYQAQETNGADVTDWVEEGAAMWVAAKLVPGSTITTEKWGPYLKDPAKSLYQRKYDAIGFFGHLEHVGIDVWPLIVPMMQAADDEAAFAIGTAGSLAALDDWPSGLARESAFGQSWTTDGPDIPATQPPRVEKTVANGTSATSALPAAANRVFALDVESDVLVVDAEDGTRGRLRDATGGEWILSGVSGRPLCALEGGCICPDGSPGAGIEFATLAPGTALMGVTGGAGTAKVTVRGRSLDDYCKKPATVDPCLVGTWVSQSVDIAVPGLPIVGTGGAGAILQIAKTGAGSVNLDPSSPVTSTLPGGFVGTFTLRGTTSGVLTAANGVVTTLASGSTSAAIDIDVAGLSAYTVPLGNGSNAATAFDGSYECSPDTLVYSAPAFGGKSTWSRQ